MRGQEIPQFLQEMEAKWPATFVVRERVEEFTGGLISSGHIGNLDRQGRGPNRLKMGRKVVYPIKEFIAWLAARITEDDGSDGPKQ